MDGIVTPPLISERDRNGDKLRDIFSFLMDKERIVYLGSEIDQAVSAIVSMQMTYLNSVSDDEPIKLYINSYGGQVSDMLLIYDTMMHVNAPIHTYCLGAAYSAAAVLLLSGEKGHRYAMPHSRVMLHQVNGGVSGRSDDIQSAADHVRSLGDDISKIIAAHTPMSLAEVAEMTVKDTYMTAARAVELGIVDRVLGR